MAIPRYDTHICLVSEQNLPNLLPVLFEPFRPRRVILLVTPSMVTRATQLEKILRDRGIGSERCGVDAYSFEAMRQRVFEVVSTVDEKAALNLTGGTKVMALGAFDIALDFDLPVFYLDSRDQRLLLLRPDGESIPLPELLKVKTALTAHGYNLLESREQRVSPQSRQLTETLVQQAERWQTALGTINYMAAKARKKLTQPVDIPGSRKRQDLDGLLELFAEAKLLSIDSSRDQVVFADEVSRFYVNGGWLEEYCQKVALQLKRAGQLCDVEANLKIASADGVQNELDLAFTARNRLHLLECKTANLAGAENLGRAETRAAHVGYKLDTLRDFVGGSFGKAMLVSFLPLPEVDRVRCESYGIKVVQTRHLAFLREEILQWGG